MKINSEWKDAFMHLRLHFSLFLLPIFLFAFSQSPVIVGVDAFVTFVLLHLFVYPSSNAYNSYHDQDIGSIGGLKNPPPVNHKVLILSNILDLIAIAAAFMVKMELSLYLLVYIIISRLYSNRKIRLKKYPYIGFSVIFIAQGAFTYFVCSLGVGEQWETTSYLTFFHSHIFALLACSFQIGAIYPLTQIYQHKSDLEDGVATLSYKLGYAGTFIFSGIMFTIATGFYFLHFKEINLQTFYTLLVVQIPIVAYFVYWFSLVLRDSTNANYKNTMTMNTIAAAVLNLFFLYLVINR